MLGGTRGARTGRAGFPFGTGGLEYPRTDENLLARSVNPQRVNLRKRAQAN